MGRSELAVPIISTQLVTDALVGERESLENLIGATFVFGMRSEAEAARALTLLGLDPDGHADAPALLELEAGRCLFRDHRGRVEAIQVDVVLPGAAAGLLDHAARHVTWRRRALALTVVVAAVGNCVACDRSSAARRSPARRGAWAAE